MYVPSSAKNDTHKKTDHLLESTYHATTRKIKFSEWGISSGSQNGLTRFQLTNLKCKKGASGVTGLVKYSLSRWRRNNFYVATDQGKSTDGLNYYTWRALLPPDGPNFIFLPFSIFELGKVGEISRCPLDALDVIMSSGLGSKFSRSSLERTLAHLNDGIERDSNGCMGAISRAWRGQHVSDGPQKALAAAIVEINEAHAASDSNSGHSADKGSSSSSSSSSSTAVPRAAQGRRRIGISSGGFTLPDGIVLSRLRLGLLDGLVFECLPGSCITINNPSGSIERQTYNYWTGNLPPLLETEIRAARLFYAKIRHETGDLKNEVTKEEVRFLSVPLAARSSIVIP
jgi:hypothetical protein